MMHVILERIGAGIFCGELQGFDDPKLEVFAGPLQTGRKYISLWEKPEPMLSILYASGELSFDGETWEGDIVSVRRGKARSWHATAARGSKRIEFVEHV